VLFQDTSPIAISVAENITGCEVEDANKERMEACLKKAGLYEKIQTLPKI
jgi:ATP-binding cassette subfamily B protein